MPVFRPSGAIRIGKHWLTSRYSWQLRSINREIEAYSRALTKQPADYDGSDSRENIPETQGTNPSEPVPVDHWKFDGLMVLQCTSQCLSQLQPLESRVQGHRTMHGLAG